MTGAGSGLVLEQVRRLAGGGGAGQPTDGLLLERFAACRDEAAFATLVRRHGPMVLAVCRGVLRHEQDAEDAFQATFLILAKKAGSIRRPEAVAGWLYEVAHHVAAKAQREAARRQAREQRAAPLSPADPALDMTVRDLRRVLHEELRRLPDKYRLPLVLCYLEGRSQAESADQLGWSKGTFRGRLDRGRERLRRRLAARGVALSALLFAPAAAPRAAAESLVASVVRAASLSAVGEPAMLAVSARACALVGAVSCALLTGKLKVATALFLAASLLAGAGALAHQTRAAREDAMPAAVQKPEAGKKQLMTEQPADTRGVRGRVLDPKGKPVAGAQLIFVYATAYKYPDKVWATSGTDGGFQFSLPEAALKDPMWQESRQYTYVVASAGGLGTGMAHVTPRNAGDVNVQLVSDDVPVDGRVLDLQGQPVVGATVRINDRLDFPRAGDLSGWLEALRVDKRNPGQADGTHLISLYSLAFVRMFPPVTTGPDGRFRIRGLGRERVVSLRVEGPTIVTSEISVMTRAEAPIRLPREKNRADRRPLTHYGARFDLVVPPTKPVVGVVRDRDTGKPLADVTVHSHIIAGASLPDDYLLRTRTDRDGRFRLVGLPKGEGNRIMAEVEDMPYLPAIHAVPDTPGLEPVAVAIALPRGLWVRGRITDKVTGQPIKAYVEYFCPLDNPHLKGWRLDETNRWTIAHGVYRKVALPGPGFIGVWAGNNKLYRPGVGAACIKAKRYGDLDLIMARPYSPIPANFHALAPIDAEPGAEAITCDVELDPGHTLTGTVVGPDGRPLAGARVSGAQPMGFWEKEPLKGAEFTVLCLGDEESRLVQVLHEGKHLAGAQVVKGDTKEAVRVQLQPWGSVSGRLVKPNGEPLTGVEIATSWGGKKDGNQVGYLPESGRPDQSGRFRMDGLIAGFTYNLSVRQPSCLYRINGAAEKKVSVLAGETRDLGDLQVVPLE
jgi:RNA polymerase sigma factor (sigma-70 family)